uniref:G-protein coupled receptors family 1 profile domain-containing protein n=1 Tax=Dicentrarchus labrax TaxID=13489 RepID=A0A8C4IF22_DICLA
MCWLKGFVSFTLNVTDSRSSWFLKVGVSLNGLVVWALGLRGNPSSFRIYVLNLAMADLVLLMRTPLMLGYIAHNYSWPFGHVFCRLVIFLRGLGLYASAFLLCAVALERCLCLLRPVWARLRRPSWAVPLACGILWLLATTLSAPYLHSAVLIEINGTYQCLDSGEFDMALFLTETIAGFILPLLVFLGSNLAVVLKVKQAMPPTPTSPSAMKNRAHIGKYISLFLVYIKSALNPVLYVFAARGLSRAIRASLVSTIERLFNDDSSESIRRKSLKNSLKNSQM